MKIKKTALFALAILSVGIFSSCQNMTGKNGDQSNVTQMDTVKITLLQTADIHGQLDPHLELFWENDSIIFKERGGLAHIQTLFKEEKAKNPNTFIVDGGDLIQGSGYAALSQGSIFPDIIKNMDFDLIIPGNWEVVYGKDVMMEVMTAFETPIIAQNMFHEDGQKELFPPFWIQEIAGVKLGFIGINDPDVPIRQNPIFSEGINFTGIDDGVKELIQKVKHEEKVDALFLVTHIGIFKQVELANNPIVADVDYILGNDTHERIRKPIEGKYAKVTEPGAFGSFVGKLDLYFVNGKIVREEYELMDVDPERYKADPLIADL
ncbi:MAG TPA: metallophosphoesterase, partial [Gillisia sp.]|nr:metallophosphoesterase [Gillisia sp.]